MIGFPSFARRLRTLLTGRIPLLVVAVDLRRDKRKRHRNHTVIGAELLPARRILQQRLDEYARLLVVQHLPLLQRVEIKHDRLVFSHDITS